MIGVKVFWKELGWWERGNKTWKWKRKAQNALQSWSHSTISHLSVPCLGEGELDPLIISLARPINSCMKLDQGWGTSGKQLNSPSPSYLFSGQMGGETVKMQSGGVAHFKPPKEGEMHFFTTELPTKYRKHENPPHSLSSILKPSPYFLWSTKAQLYTLHNLYATDLVMLAFYKKMPSTEESHFIKFICFFVLDFYCDIIWGRQLCCNHLLNHPLKADLRLRSVLPCRGN